MGGQQSVTAPPPPAKTLTDVPWRQPSHWDAELEQSLIAEIKEMDPEKKPNLLMIGPVGAGKSSFINSILSIGKGRKVALASTGESGEASWTLDLESYTKGTLLKRYRLYDCMGVEPSEGQGFHVEDLVFLIKGHIKKGYTFNPVSPISTKSSEYRSSPGFEHKTHCVIFVISATTIHAGIPPAYVQKIKQLQDKIRREHIPRILILTKVEEVCNEVEKNFKNLFRSVRIKEAVKTASEIFGIEQASIHPVKNYEVDSNVQMETNIPLLLAIKQTMQYAADRVEYVLQDDSDED